MRASAIRGDTFVDIGAHIGLYTALLRRNFRVVYSFEPHPENFGILSRVAKVGKWKNVFLFPHAILDTDGLALLYVSRDSGRHTLEQTFSRGPIFDLKRSARDQKNRIEVNTMKLDTFITRQGLPCVDLVKVDVEGAEWRVLKGAEKSMNLIKRWIIEVHDKDRRMELDVYLRDKGYLTSWLDPRHIFAVRKSK